MASVVKRLKDYFNAQEVNDFMTLKFVGYMAGKVMKEWGDRGNLTKEETTQLKYVSTYAEKFFNSVGSRLDVKEKTKIAKRLSKFDFRIVDEYMMNKVDRDMTDKLQYAVMPREQFDTFCGEIMDVRCSGCDKPWQDCELHDVFENNLAPEPTGYEKVNCRFAYDPADCSSRTVLRIAEK